MFCGVCIGPQIFVGVSVLLICSFRWAGNSVFGWWIYACSNFIILMIFWEWHLTQIARFVWPSVQNPKHLVCFHTRQKKASNPHIWSRFWSAFFFWNMTKTTDCKRNLPWLYINRKIDWVTAATKFHSGANDNLLALGSLSGIRWP